MYIVYLLGLLKERVHWPEVNNVPVKSRLNAFLPGVPRQGDCLDDKTPFPGAKARMTHCVGAVVLKPWRHVSLTCSAFFVLTRCKTVLKLHFSRAVPQSYLGCWLLGYRPQCGSNKTLFFKGFFFFLMWTIFKVFIEFVTILLLFYVLDFGSQNT